MKFFFSRKHRITDDLRSQHNAPHLSHTAKKRILHSILQEAESVSWQPRPRTRRGFTLYIPQPMIPAIIAAVLILGSAGTVIAADGAKPGDTLFGVDRAAERVRLVLTFRETSKAQVKAEIAEEREQERQQLLQETNTELTEEASLLADQALTDAIEALSRVRLSLESKGDIALASRALTDIEDRLRSILELRLQAETRTASTVSSAPTSEQEDDQEVPVGDAVTNDDALDDDTAHVDETDESDALNVNDDDELDDTSDDAGDDSSDDETEDAEDDSNNTNSDDDSDDTDDDSTNTNVNTNSATNTNGTTNTNTNANVNVNTNSNTNTNDDDQSEEYEIRVEVEDNTARIRVRSGNDEEDEWELTTTDETTILLSIAARTGLTTSYIQSIWEFEYSGGDE